MKLHLPLSFRRALLSCITPLSLATLTFTPQLIAEDEDEEEVPYGYFYDESAKITGTYTQFYAENSHLTSTGTTSISGTYPKLDENSSLTNKGTLELSASTQIQFYGKVTNSGTINVNSKNFPIFGTLVNSSNAEISQSGNLQIDNLTNEGAITGGGISVYDSFSNSGVITASGTPASGTDGSRANGLALAASGSNSGTITTSASGGSLTSAGILLYSGAVLNNSSTIIAKASTGIQAALRNNDTGTLINSGKIEITANREGLYFRWGSALTNTSAGEISITASGESPIGAAFYASDLDNYGSMLMSVSGSSQSYGIYADQDSHISNSGTMDITTSGGYSVGIMTYNGFTNTSGAKLYIESSGSGIEACNDVVNNGTMEVTASQYGLCLYSYEEESSFYNSGKLIVQTTGSSSVAVTCSYLENLGHLDITSSGIGIQDTYIINYDSLGIESSEYAIEGGSLYNCEQVTINSATGIYGTSVTNNASGDIEISSSSSGIQSSSVYNSGLFNIESSGYGLSSCYLKNYGGVMEISGDNAGINNSSYYYVSNSSGAILRISSSLGNGIQGGSVSNEGTLEINSLGTGISTSKSIQNMTGANLSIISTNGMGIDGALVNKGTAYINSLGTGITGNVTNSGELTIKSEYAGISENASAVSNSGEISIECISSQGTVYGILLGEQSATLTNEGTLHITAEASLSGGNTAYGISLSSASTLANSGSIETRVQGYDAFGIYLSDSASLTNSGSIYCVNGGIYLENASAINLQGGKIESGFNTEPSVHLVASSLTNEGDVEAHGSFRGMRLEDSSVILGGAGVEKAAVAGDSQVTVDSHFAVSGVTLNLADDVRLKMGGDLTIAEDVTINRNDHRLTVDNGETARNVTIGSNVAAEWNGAVAVETEEGKLKLSSEGDNTMSNGTLAAESITVEAAAGTTMTLQDMTLSVSGDEITLTNIVVRGDSSFTSASGSLTLHVDGVTFVLDGSNSFGAEQQVQPFAMLLSVDPLTETEVASNVFYIDSDRLGGVNVSGSMTLDLSFWADEIEAGGYDSISLTFADDMNFDENTEVLATLNGVDYATADYTGENMAQFSVASLPTQVIPEPATATLSLLALTALAARRRRK